MRYFPKAPGLAAWLFLFSVAGLLASGAAHSTTAVSHYVVIQPIDVCASNGTGCAAFCSTVVNSASASPSSVCVTNPATAITSTPIGFVDPATNINITRAIWLQAGIDVTFLPLVQYNNTSFQSISVTCSTSDSPCSGPLASSQFHDLSTGTGTAATSATGCTSHCTDPVGTNALSPKANAINMFFVNSLVPGAGVASPLYGFAWINGQGVAVARNTFFPPFPVTPRFDTLAHEIGHNLGLDHSSGGGSANNVMTAGLGRAVPSSSGCLTTNSGGALFDLDVLTIFDCPTLPATPIADQLINTEESTVLPSGFLNPIPNVAATAGGGGGFAAARINSSSSGSSGISFEIDNNGGGRDSQGEFIKYVIIALAPGLDFQGNTPATQTGGSDSVKIISQQRLNGNNGLGNPNCQKQVGVAPPSIHCLQITFTPGKFVAGQFVTFTLAIIENDVPLTITADLAGTGFTTVLETDNTTSAGTTPIALFATTSKFETVGGVLQPANSQTPDATTPSVILSTGGSFVGNSQNPCTLAGLICPPLAGGDPGSPGSSMNLTITPND